MAVTQTASGSTFNIFKADGIEDEFVYTFSVLGTFSSIVVSVLEVGEVSFSQKIQDTHYTLNRDTKTIDFFSSDIPGNLALVKIERSTNRARQVDYVSGTTLSARNLDNDANRLTSVDEEIEEGVSDALLKNAAKTDWDGENLPSENCGQATKATGWVTLAQMQAELQGVTTTQISSGAVFTFTGDGLTTEFELNDLKGLTRALISVWIENVYQSADAVTNVYDVLTADDSLYPTLGDGDDFISFTEAPPLNAIIEVRVLTGQVLAEVTDLSISTGKIADNAVTLSKINVGAGVSDRYMVFDTSGDPTTKRIGMQDLLADPQTLSSPLRTALTALAGLGLDDFLALVQGNIDINSFKIVNAGPTQAADASTTLTSKGYVDSEITSAVGSIFTLQTQLLSPDLAGSDGLVRTFALTFRPDLLICMPTVQSASFGFAVLVAQRGVASTVFLHEFAWSFKVAASDSDTDVTYSGSGGTLTAQRWNIFALKV